MKKAFGTRGFTRLYVGLTASMLGDSLMLIVLGMWVKTLTGSNGAAGLTFLWLTAPALLAPLFGYVVDRVPRRALLVVANLLSAAAMLPLLLVHDEGDVWLIYAVTFLYGISFVVVPAALNGLMKDLLPEDVLVEANASLSVTREALRLVGPLAGASLFALTGGGALVGMIDALTFVVAALAVLGLRVHETPPTAEPMHWRAEVAAGARHLRVTPVLLHSTVALALCVLVLGFSESAIYAVVDAFDRPVEFVGPLLTVQGVGAVVAGLLSARVIRRLGEPRALVLGLGLMALGLATVATGSVLAQLLVGTAVLGSGIPVAIVAYNTLLQKLTPGQLMGRVTAATDVLVTTPQALSIALGSLLVTLVDWRIIFAAMTVGSVLAAVYLLVVLRGRLTPPAPVEPEPVQDELIPGSVLPDAVVDPVAPPTVTG